MTTNSLDSMEGRPNGRLVCYDPVTRRTWTVLNHFYFPNGICVSHDGRSVLSASTSLCKVFRLWLEGPDKTKREVWLDEIPGNCDNINRASDGNYWLALVGIRTPAFDLAMRKPGFRLRMVKQVPTDEWLAPGLNHGCVLKFTEQGEVLESYWDPTGISHSTLTSMREHKGYLSLGGLAGEGYGERSVFATFDGNAGGLAFHPDGRLLVCVAGRGLAAVDGAGRQTWLNQVADRPLNCLTAIVAGGDGRIFASNGSSWNLPDAWCGDLMQKHRLGRLVACGPGLDRAEVLLDGLHYPHGLAIAPDGGSLTFPQTFNHPLRPPPLLDLRT